MYAVSFEEAGFAYDGTTFIFRNLDLNIGEGEFVCIIGGNGSGKSTLAKHINALLIPCEGRVLVFEYNTLDKDLIYQVRSNTGMVFQNPDDQLIANLVENDVAFGPENLGVEERELRRRIEDALGATGLAGFEHIEISTLSGGQKQRLAIADALAMQPALLILDEASAMLDAQGRNELMQTIKKLHAQGMTLVMITHFMEEAALADRVIALSSGHICMDGTPQQVLSSTEQLQALRLQPPFAARISDALRAEGIPIQTCITPNELEEAICKLHLST